MSLKRNRKSKNIPKLAKKSDDLVLDGQQRLTAIYYAIKAPDVNLPRKKQPYRYFVNINALLDDTKPSDEIVATAVCGPPTETSASVPIGHTFPSLDIISNS